MSSAASTLAWHWTNGKTLRDGSPIPPEGHTIRHDGPVTMCVSGLHASRKVLDALYYAPGPIVHRVRVSRIVGEQDDKLVARERTILWSVDAEDLLRDFARRCAFDVIHLWDAPDVVREYLKTGDETLRAAARDAAFAAWDAGWASRAATWATYRTAARDARWAARAGTWAGATARDAAWDAGWAKQHRRLTAMISARKP